VFLLLGHTTLAPCQTYVEIHPPQWIGRTHFGGVVRPILGHASAGNWSLNERSLIARQAYGLGQTQTLESVPISLAGATGDVRLTADLLAQEMNDIAGFDTTDVLKVELLLDSNPTAISLIDPWDANHDGQLTGAELTALSVTTPTGRQAARLLSAVIPDAVTTARVRLTTRNASRHESFTLTRLTLTESAPTLDTDGDGADDQEEAITGTDPLNPDSVLRVSSVTSSSPSGQTATKLTVPSEPGRTYTLYTSADLNTWVAVPECPPQRGSGLALEFTCPAAPLRRYLRVEVSL
jgi:hypothetical protein